MISTAKFLVVLAVFMLSAYIHSNDYTGSHLRVTPVTFSGEKAYSVVDIIPSRHLGETPVDNSTTPHDDDHTDDHPSTGHSAGHPSLFEALSAIHIEIGTYSVLIIIGFIILLKQMIEALYTCTHDTPFHGMVKNIEEELMIVGTSSFIFKVVLNTTTFGKNEWAYPLEFGEVLIPLVAFSYCGIGVFMIMCSFKQCYTWSRAHNLATMEILDDYFTASKTWFFRLTWKPMNASIEQMEFRIFHSIFCNTFRIQKDAFAFDEYVAKVFQRSVLELIEIRFLDWFYVTCLLLLNLARVKLNLNLNPCDHNSIDCDNKRTVRLFTLAGTIIFIFTFALLIASRRLELNIMSRSGPKSHRDYAEFLRKEEEKQQTYSFQLMNKDQLKVAAAKAKEKEGGEGGGGHGGGHKQSTIAAISSKIGRASIIQLSSMSMSGKAAGASAKQKVTPFDDSKDSKETVLTPHAEPANENGNTTEITPLSLAEPLRPSELTAVSPHSDNSDSDSESEKPETSEVDDITGEDLSELPRGRKEEIKRGAFALSNSGSEKSDTFRGAEAVSPTPQPSATAATAEAEAHTEESIPILRKGHSAHIRTSQINAIHDLTFGEHSLEAKEMFWFGKPELHFESVQILFMIISLYAALWLTVIVSLNNSEWRFLSVAPAVLILVFFFYIVKTAALLKAVYVVDTDALLEVIEETEAAKQLSLELRDRVLERLEQSDDPFEEIQRLYNEIDINRSDSLSRSEFGKFMELMGISFSMKKWEKIFKEIDRNYDNEISLNEFLLFLYPDHDLALSQESKRLEGISKRVMDRANNIFAPLGEIVGTLVRINSSNLTVPSSNSNAPNADGSPANTTESNGVNNANNTAASRPSMNRTRSTISAAMASGAAARRRSVVDVPRFQPELTPLQ